MSDWGEKEEIYRKEGKKLYRVTMDIWFTEKELKEAEECIGEDPFELGVTTRTIEKIDDKELS